MIAITAELWAQPGKEQAVEQALREMVQVASDRYPTLPGYALLQSEDDPQQFVMYAEFTSVEDRLPDHKAEELMLVGTGLRESLSEPIVIHRYNLLAEAARPAGAAG